LGKEKNKEKQNKKMLSCQVSFVVVDDSSEGEWEEVDEITDKMVTEVLLDALSIYGLVSTLTTLKRSKRSLVLEITMQKGSEAIGAAEGLDGCSLPLTSSTSSLLKTHFLGTKSQSLVVTFASPSPQNLVLTRRRFACSGQLDSVSFLPFDDDAKTKQETAVLATFSSFQGAQRAVEDFESRDGLPKGTTVELVVLQDQDKKNKRVHVSPAPSGKRNRPPSESSKPAIEEEGEDVPNQLFIVHSKQIQSDVLKSFFESFPGCTQVSIMQTKKKHDCVRGTSFVTFDTPESAKKAQQEWHGKIFPPDSDQPPLKVVFAKVQRLLPSHVTPPQQEEFNASPDTLIEPFGSAMAFSTQSPPTPPLVQPSPPPPTRPQLVSYSPPTPPQPHYQQPPPYWSAPPMQAPSWTPPHQWGASPEYWNPMYPPPPPPAYFPPHFALFEQQMIDNCRLYVSYTKSDAANATMLTEDHITYFFSSAAPELVHVYKIKDRPMFFVKYRSSTSAMQAMLRLNGYNLYGCTLRVVLADPPNHRTSAGGTENENKRRRDDERTTKEED
jgi:hypothetical protein